MARSRVASPEILSSPEFIVSGETLDLVSGLGNHEAKLLTLLYLGLIDEYEYAQRMGEGFIKFLGPEADMKPNTLSAYNYCQNSLEPIGQVVTQQVRSRRGRLTNGYGLSERGSELGIPLAGHLLAWSLEFPDVSLQTILGPTNSVGVNRAPQNRLRLLLHLLTAPSKVLSLSDIAEADGYPPNTLAYHGNLSNLENASNRLAEEGIVDISRVADKNERVYEIVSTEYPEGSANRSLVVHGLYAFIKAHAAKGSSLFNFNECLEFVCDWVLAQDQTVDPADIRRHLTGTLTGNKERGSRQYYAVPGIKRIDETRRRQLTKIRLIEDVRPAIEKLLEIVLGADAKSPAFIEDGKALADIIAGDNRMKGLLIDKAYRFSPAARKRPQAETIQQLLELLGRSDGPLSADVIQITYNNEHDRDLKADSIQHLLWLMASSGLITITSQRNRSSIRTQQSVYSISEH